MNLVYTECHYNFCLFYTYIFCSALFWIQLNSRDLLWNVGSELKYMFIVFVNVSFYFIVQPTYFIMQPTYATSGWNETHLLLGVTFSGKYGTCGIIIIISHSVLQKWVLTLAVFLVWNWGPRPLCRAPVRPTPPTAAPVPVPWAPSPGEGWLAGVETVPVTWRSWKRNGEHS